MGATSAPILAGTLAQKHGLAVTMWLAAAGSGLLFLVTLFLRETGPAAMLAINPAIGASLPQQDR
jgi:hypothetical protein